MTFKKALSVAVAASAVAAMSICAMADPIGTIPGAAVSSSNIWGSGGDGAYVIAGDYDFTKIDKVVVDVEATSSYVKGVIGANKGGQWTVTGEQEISGADGAAAVGQFVWENVGGLDETPQVQVWWINSVNANEEAKTADPGSLNINAVTLYDADGNVIFANPAAEPATGDATPVVAVAALALVAGAALVATKKFA